MITSNPRPIRVYESFPVKLAIWERYVENDKGAKPMRSATLTRVYKDGSGAWRMSRSLNVEDLPKAMILIQRAFIEFGIVLDELPRR